MLLRQRNTPSGKVLELCQGDLTAQAVDAIVNAANAHLQHGGGMAAAIVHKGGRVIQEESDAWVRAHGPVGYDTPAHTSAGKLPCRYVIHAVGPVWGEGDEDARLMAAVGGALRRAGELGLESVALPAISTGIFGFPKGRAAGLIYAAVWAFFQQAEASSIRLARVVIYDDATREAFEAAWDMWVRGAG
jgi:O-acetyl-ADP-ribose deacetylase (regulator of RNase III)